MTLQEEEPAGFRATESGDGWGYMRQAATKLGWLACHLAPIAAAVLVEHQIDPGTGPEALAGVGGFVLSGLVIAIEERHKALRDHPD